MYDQSRQYRCTIIRGKSQKEMDDMLPAYAKVIDEICPCPASDFEVMFNNAFMHYLPEASRKKKTLDNHRTEISGKLFGMYYLAEDNIVYKSERTQKFMEDDDQPAFFKDICYKMQFPNGTQKCCPTVITRVNDGINIRPNSFLLKFLQVAKAAKVEITKKDIGYYILNSLDVLCGKASPYEVLEAIVDDRNNGIERTISVPGKQSSYTWQHITEQLNYLELANLIRIVDGKRIVLNPNEEETINIFAEDWNKSPMFDVRSYDLDTLEGRKIFQLAWDAYFSRLSPCADKFATPVDALVVDLRKDGDSDEQKDVKENSGAKLIELGDEGEAIVFEYEKKRVADFDKKLVNKVLSLGKIKGLGYDIQSIIAEPGDESEYAKYIEVKSTKRYTCPDVDDSLWADTLNVTRKEWIAAQQHRAFYYFYRVYFTSEGVSLFILKDPAQKAEEGVLQVTPVTYRMDFSAEAVDAVVPDIKEESE